MRAGAADGVKHFFPMKQFAYIVMILSVAGAVLAADEQSFPSPDAAIDALRTAAKNHDKDAFSALFGPHLGELVSPDPVQSSNALERFSMRLSQKVAPVTNSDSRIILNLGYDAWPFPIPLVKENDQWHFDTMAGKDEILNRRIGHDELDAIRVCHTYVAAQREYASADQEGDGVMQYAQTLRSNPGKHDGLYWHAEPGEATSPLGPLIAQAKAEGYTKGTKILSTNEVPFHGYFFHILTQQGPHAPGGEYNYIINGHMVAGFGLVAWPAEWGNSGVMTFIVNQQGRVYEKNLGPNTDDLARGMTVYDPDSTWKASD